MWAACVVGAILLAACATTESETWTKAGATEEQVNRDRSECMSQARVVVPSADGPRMRMDYPRYQRCMGERGYTMTK
jgi:hypothetical protein